MHSLARASALWQRFWFQPSPATVPAAMCIGCGAIIFISLLSMRADVLLQFSADGWLAPEVAPWFARYPYTLSHFDYITDPATLLVIHGLACAAALLFTLGVAAAITGPLIFAALL